MTKMYVKCEKKMWLSPWTKPRVGKPGRSVGGRGVRTCCSIRGCSKKHREKKKKKARMRRVLEQGTFDLVERVGRCRE